MMMLYFWACKLRTDDDIDGDADDDVRLLLGFLVRLIVPTDGISALFTFLFRSMPRLLLVF